MQKTKTASESNGGFKTQNRTLTRKIEKLQKELAVLVKQEQRACNRWVKGYGGYRKAAKGLTEVSRLGTKKFQYLSNIVNGWDKETVRLTIERDALREKVAEKKNEIETAATERLLLQERHLSDSKAFDEIVTQVFSLNEVVVRASEDRGDCLKRHVFPRLYDAKGNLRSQISFVSADGLRKVVAMVNTMTLLRPDLAAKAKELVQQFFERFREVTEMDPSVKPLYDLTQQLLIEKTGFKVGPSLHQFLGMELPADVFPELAEAQMLLRQSLRSEKTNSYIRLYRRDAVTSPWVPVPQS